jgi:hypothetical protein
MLSAAALNTPPRITRSMNNRFKTPTQPRRVPVTPTAPVKPNVRFAMMEEEECELERPGTTPTPNRFSENCPNSNPGPSSVNAGNCPNSETIDFLADENHEGFKVRYNKEKGLLSAVDLGQGLSGMNLKRASEALINIKKQYLTFSEKIGKHKFAQNEKPTWACDITTAIELCQLYPGKAAAEFRRSCAVTIRRVLAGDETLIDEIVGNSLRTDQVSQLMQDANAAAGPSRQRRNAVTPVDPHRSDIWYASRELKSKPRHNVRSQMMREKFPELTQKDYKEWNTKLCETVTGVTPKEFSAMTGANRNNRRDYYNSWGLATQSWLDSTAVEFMQNENINDFKDFKEGFDEIAELMGNLQKKKKLFHPLPEKPTRRILSAQEALAIENETPEENRRKVDNIYQ